MVERVGDGWVGGIGEGDMGRDLGERDGEFKDGDCFKLLEDVWGVVKEKG